MGISYIITSGISQKNRLKRWMVPRSETLRPYNWQNPDFPQSGALPSLRLRPGCRRLSDSMYNGYFLYYNKRYITEEQVKTLDGILEAAASSGKLFTMDWSPCILSPGILYRNGIPYAAYACYHRTILYPVQKRFVRYMRIR